MVSTRIYHRLDKSYDGHVLSEETGDVLRIFADLLQKLREFAEIIPEIKEEVERIAGFSEEAVKSGNERAVEYWLYERVIPLLNHIAPADTEVSVPSGQESGICFTSKPTDFDVHFAITGFHTISGISEDHVRYSMNKIIDDVIDDVEKLLKTGVKDDDYVTDIIRL